MHSQDCYSSCLGEMKITCMLFLKYLNKLDVTLLDSIIMRLDNQYRSEKEYLGIYVAGIDNWYYRHILSRKIEMVVRQKGLKSGQAQFQ